MKHEFRQPYQEGYEDGYKMGVENTLNRIEILLGKYDLKTVVEIIKSLNKKEIK